MQSSICDLNLSIWNYHSINLIKPICSSKIIDNLINILNWIDPVLRLLLLLRHTKVFCIELNKNEVIDTWIIVFDAKMTERTRI